MSFLKKSMGKVAAVTMVAGFILVGGMGAANASEVPPPPPSVEQPPVLPPPDADNAAPIPAPVVHAPGKSAEHRAETPQQALDNNQSHKQDAKKAEKGK